MRNVKSKTRRSVYNRDDYTCYICGKKVVVGVDATVDHYVPRSKGGTNREKNLRTCCKPCNEAKGSMRTEPTEEWGDVGKKKQSQSQQKRQSRKIKRRAERRKQKEAMRVENRQRIINGDAE